MCRCLLALCLFSAAAQPTTVVVIGTRHEPNARFAKQDLVEALCRVRPSAILVEADQSLLDQMYLSHTVEGYAVRDYEKIAPVEVLPYDIKNRNQIYSRFGYFELQREFFRVLHALYMDYQLVPEARTLYKEYLSASQMSQAFDQGSMDLFNSVTCDEAIERLHQTADRNFARIIKLTPGLARFATYAGFEKEFWELRNSTMVRNILHHTHDFPGGRIAVLCGFHHRYYLVSHLQAGREKAGIQVREYWSYY